MSKVIILLPDVIAKIAAGEVVDRPASVIKELIENAIDAGATDIHIKLKNAGSTLMTIKDNGCGIEEDDLKNIFHRHATSKIQSAKDLFDIHSLGFRGEALFSIAAISDVRLKSKTAEQQDGWAIHMRGGDKQSLKPCALNSPGTEIEINELFFNTPARKKFLKTNTTEMNHILNIFIPYTLLHNNIRFLLTHQGKDLIDVHPAKNRCERICDILHHDKNHLLEETQALPGNMAIQMILGDMNIKRTRRDMQFIYINGRPVQNKNISFHMNQIYRLILANKEFPFFFLNIALPADEIDVNIHPAKREVKFKNEQALCSILRKMCEQTLMQKGSIKQIAEPKIHTTSPLSNQLSRANPKSESFAFQTRDEKIIFSTETHKQSSENYAFPKSTLKEKQTWFIPKGSLKSSDNSIHEKFTNASYIGSFMNKFLLFNSGTALLIVDQHAAQERIMYETFIRQMNAGNMEVQNLLSPVLIKLTPQEMNVWDQYQKTIEKLGFDNNQWDPHTIAVHTHPSLIYDVEQSVRNIISGEKIERSDHDTLARRACKASVRAGDHLTAQQAEFQREQLLQCLDPFTCPHGRPTIIELTENYLDKQFLRT